MNHPPSTNTRTLPTEPPTESLADWRYVVYFEHLALWKETDPQLRANIAKQLAEWTQILAAMEAEAAQAAARDEG